MSEAEHLSPNQRALRRFRRNKPALVSLAFLGLMLLAILFFPTAKPDAHSAAQFTPPSSAHWFGTDIHGRDIFARAMTGGRISLLVGAVGAGVSLVIGVLWGAIAGYTGGRTDTLMMRIVDILYAMPFVIFVILLMALFGRNIFLLHRFDRAPLDMPAFRSVDHVASLDRPPVEIGNQSCAG